MKKNLLAVLVAASAVLSVQAIAAGNTAQLVIHGTVVDSNESCNITPGAGAITGGTVILDDIKASVLEAAAINTPVMASAKDITYKVEDCMKGGTAFTGDLKVTISGNYMAGKPDILNNEAAKPAQNAALAMLHKDSSRVKFDGTDVKTIAYKAGTPTILSYKAAYVKTADGVTVGDVKGVTTFTVTY